MKKKRNNPLSVWPGYCSFSYFLRCPFHTLKELWIGLQNFIHRGRYGFGYCDVWEWSSWWTTVGAEALRYLAKHGYGYPGYKPWETPDEWHAYLLDLADKLQWCGQSCDNPYDNPDRNEYYAQMTEIRQKKYRNNLPLTNEEEEIKEKYWKRAEEIEQEDNLKREQIFTEIGKHLGRFWD